MKFAASTAWPRRLKRTRIATVLLTALTGFASGVSADDTEVFFGQNSTQANVLFIIDVSGSMAWYDDANSSDHSDDPYFPGDTSRLEKLQAALTDIINTTNDINVGLLSFTGYGNMLREEIKPVTENRANMLASIAALNADGGTPTVGALLEGGQYYRGEALRDSGLTYDSPMLSACQTNHIVLLTDGEPTDAGARSDVEKAIYGNTTTTCPNATIVDGSCGAELATYLYETDHHNVLADKNNIVTHTIGFNFSEDWLETVSTAGHGQHFNAESASDLVDAFDSILEVANNSSNTFAAPAITLDQFTRFSHRDDMYLALFQPSNTQRWSGNLKRYKFDKHVKDKNDALALDTTTGTFTADATSFWSTEADGGNVALGGAASLLDTSTRKVYTYTGTADDLLDNSNIFHEDNSAITAAMLYVEPAARTNLMQWARGVDVDNETEGSSTRLQMGDPLHSRPAIITYGGTEDDPDSVVFIGTNEGFLHAINSSDGKEVFSFIPTDLLGNLDTYYQNERTINRLYGIDGDLTLWTKDKNDNGKIDGTDHAYLYMGMRRGGSHYYALDVTTKANPKFLWSITADSVADDDNNGVPDFEKLGQSWSKPTLSKISVNGNATDVLIFGGGYNPMLDHSSTRTPDGVGNDIFIVNAATGKLIWNSSTAADGLVNTAAMQYSIPSDLRIIDINGDDFVDQIYVGDMGGQVWRFDIDNRTSTAAALVSGGVIANLSADIDSANNRQFFYPPDVALVEHHGQKFLSVAIGSGNRAHPLGRAVDDRFYMIRQKDILNKPAGYGMKDPIESDDTQTVYRAIKEGDLYNATENLIQSNTVSIADDASDELQEKQGWLLEMESSGEKVLASSLTVSNQIIFTSYLPDTAVNDNCSPAVGTGRHYSVSVFDARPPSGTAPEDRYSELPTGGIPNEPTPFIDSDGELTVLVNLEEVDTPTYKPVTRVYWTEQPDY